MAKKRLQKKREAARTASAKIETTKKVQPLKVEPPGKWSLLKVETRKTEPVKVETKKDGTLSKSKPQKTESMLKSRQKKQRPVKVETSTTGSCQILANRDDDSIY